MPLLPVLEDYELALRVRRLGRIVTLGGGGSGCGGGGGSGGGGGGGSDGNGNGDSNSGNGGLLPASAVALTSARRFAAAGLWRQCLKNQVIIMAYSSGLATPAQIGRWY
jgi:hypothetical protein